MSDPDILTARQIVLACRPDASPDWRKYLHEGRFDDKVPEVSIALMGIKVGRGLKPIPEMEIAA